VTTRARDDIDGGQVLDDCDWGPLKGIILFRSPLFDPTSSR
jgi:hypothetical protein